MASDGCQPMERFANFQTSGTGKGGSVQASWSFCPSSRVPQAGAATGGAAYPKQQAGYSVSGYVNGYNPSLPAYPPTRAQIAAAQAAGGGAMMMAPPPGQDWGAARAASGTWNGPAPAGDPSKPAPGTPYYLKTPPEPEFDPSKEEKDLPIAGGGRLPMIGCASANAAAGLAAGIAHIRCGSSSDPALASAGAAIASHGRDKVFVSAKLASDEHSDPEAACKKVLSALGVAHLDLFSIEWPTAFKPGTKEVDGARGIADTWAAMEALVDSGVCKAIGLTNCSVPVVETVSKAARIKPAVNEVELHPLLAQRKLVGVCRRYGLTLAAHTPLGGGDARLMQHPKLVEAAAMGGAARSAAELLVRWSIQRGVAVSVAGDAEVKACAQGHSFRLLNAQKAALDAMEPPPKTGGVRFHLPDFEFAFDDPFLGGAGRAGLALVPN